MAFWTEKLASGVRDPKRSFRFIIRLTSFNQSHLWFAKSVDKPNWTTNAIEHMYLNHKFNFPGRTEWSPISCKVVDPVSPDAISTLAAITTQAGYHPPTNPGDLTTTAKSLAVGALGDVVISQIDWEGKEIEKWTLWNAFLTKVTPASLDYSAEEMSEIDMEFTYDWATLEVLTDGADGTDLAGQTRFWSTDGSTDPYPGS